MEDRFRTWHLVQVSDGLNGLAVEFLKRLNIELYRPLMRVMKPVPSKKLSRAQRKSVLRPMREKIEPLFPGYAFVNYTEAGDRWREIFKIAHVRGLVCAGNLPVEVPWEMIQALVDREIDGAVPAETKLLEHPFFVGDRVRVIDGPFASFPGTIEMLPTMSKDDLACLTLEELDESCRVNLLVDIFGRATPVSLHLSQIEIH